MKSHENIPLKNQQNSKGQGCQDYIVQNQGTNSYQSKCYYPDSEYVLVDTKSVTSVPVYRIDLKNIPLI